MILAQTLYLFLSYRNGETNKLVQNYIQQRRLNVTNVIIFYVFQVVFTV